MQAAGAPRTNDEYVRLCPARGGENIPEWFASRHDGADPPTTPREPGRVTSEVAFRDGDALPVHTPDLCGGSTQNHGRYERIRWHGCLLYGSEQHHSATLWNAQSLHEGYGTPSIFRPISTNAYPAHHRSLTADDENRTARLSHNPPRDTAEEQPTYRTVTTPTHDNRVSGEPLRLVEHALNRCRVHDDAVDTWPLPTQAALSIAGNGIRRVAERPEHDRPTYRGVDSSRDDGAKANGGGPRKPGSHRDRSGGVTRTIGRHEHAEHPGSRHVNLSIRETRTSHLIPVPSAFNRSSLGGNDAIIGSIVSSDVRIRR